MSNARQRLLAAKGRTQPLTITVDGETVAVEIIALAFGERNQLVKDCTSDGRTDSTLLAPALIIATVRDAETKLPVFERADRDAVAAMPADVADQLFNAAARLNGLAADTEKALEETKGN